MIIEEYKSKDLDYVYQEYPVSTEQGDYWCYYVKVVIRSGEPHKLSHTDIYVRHEKILHKRFRSNNAARNYIRKIKNT